MTYRILLSGGGTAGSVTPLIALAEHIRRLHADSEFLFIGSSNGPERVLAQTANIPFHTISSGKLRRYWSWDNLSDVGKIWRGYRQASVIVRQWRPNVTVTAGSFISVPVIWAAHRQGIPTLVHQQDVRPGLANRLMAPAADLITVTFHRTSKAFSARKVHWVGNPVRPEILAGNPIEARKLFHLPEKVPVLLVLGGGTGSAALNSLFGAMAHKLVRQWSILHITGPERESMTLHDPRYQQYPFLTWQLAHAMAAADVVVCRAGLGTMSELAALSKAGIFLPLPDSHQLDNTSVIAEASAGIILRHTNDVQTQLEQTLERLRLHPEERQRLGRNLHQFYNPQALVQMADLTLHLIHP